MVQLNFKIYKYLDLDMSIYSFDCGGQSLYQVFQNDPIFVLSHRPALQISILKDLI